MNPGNAKDPSQVTPNQFRKMALALTEVVEQEHMGHPDFRINGKIFASLGPAALAPEEAWAMVKLTPADQTDFLARSGATFKPSSGAWGRSGCTQISLKEADSTLVRQALEAAWRNVLAPKQKNQSASKKRSTRKKTD